MFAAPIVATAVFAAGCPGRVYRNPGPPTETPPETTATAATTAPSDTAAPDTAPTAAPTSDSGDLPDAPQDGGGRVVAQADGSCLYVFPEPKMSCPPAAHCNPGPPQAPLRVKCPDGTKKP